MANAYAGIDLSLLPKPKIVEELDFEVIVESKKHYLLSLVKEEHRDEVAATLALESEPITILAQSAAYREMAIRQRINDAARAVMLAYAVGTDLDQIAGNFQVKRLVITEADPTTVPATEAELEDDASLRRRAQMAFEGFSTAGPAGAYIFHGLSAHPNVLDIGVYGPPDRPGVVQIAVLSRAGDGAADTALVDAVRDRLNAKEIRPLTDRVTVSSAQIVKYTVNATLTFYEGPDTTVVMRAAREALDVYTSLQHRMGRDITRSGIFAALHRDGVQNVVLTAPAADIVIDWNESGYCTSVTLIHGGRDE